MSHEDDGKRKTTSVRWHSIAICVMLVPLALLYIYLLLAYWNDNDFSIVFKCMCIIILLSYLVLLPAVILKDRSINSTRRIVLLNLGVGVCSLLIAYGGLMVFGRIIAEMFLRAGRTRTMIEHVSR